MPFYKAQFFQGLSNQFFLWSNQLYNGRTLTFKTELPYWFLMAPFYATDSPLLHKGFIIAIFITIFLAAYKSLKYFLNTDGLPVLIGSLLYCFNPFVYSRLMAGHLTILLAYGIFPLSIHYLFRIFKDNEHKAIIYLTLLSPFLATHLIVFIIFLFLELIIILKYIRSSLLKIIWLNASILLLNFYWMLPIVFLSVTRGIYLRPNVNVIQEANERYLYFTTISQPLYKIFSSVITPGLNTEFVYPFGNIINNIVTLCSVLIFFLAAMSLNFIKKSKNRNFLLFIYFIFLLALGIMSGSQNAVGYIFYRLLQSSIKPVFAEYSNPLRFFPLVMLPLAILFAYSYSKLRANLKVLFTLILSIFFYPWIAGHLTVPVKPDDSQPLSLHINKTNPNDRKIHNMIGSDPADFRIAILPPSLLTWPGFSGYTFPWSTLYFSKPVSLQYYDDPLTKIAMDQLFRPGSSPDLANIMGIANIRYLVYPSYKNIQSYHNFLPDLKNYAPIINANLYKQKNIGKLNENFSDADIFINQKYLPHFYAPQKMYVTSGDNSVLVNITSNENYINRSMFVPSDTDLSSFPVTMPVESVSKAHYVDYDFTKFGGNSILFPSSRFMIDSPFYFLTRFKEDKLVAGTKVDLLSSLDALMVLCGKRVFELERYLENKDPEPVTIGKIINNYHRYLRGLTSAVSGNNELNLPINEKYLLTVYKLERHLDRMQYLQSRYYDILPKSETDQVINGIVNLIGLLKSESWSNDGLTVSRYLIDIPQANMYFMSVNKPENIGSIIINGKRLNLKIDQDTKPSLQQDPIYLPKGIHKLEVNYLHQENIFRGFNYGLSGDTYTYEAKKQQQKICSQVNGVKETDKYRLNFKYKGAGFPIKVILEQDNDEISQNGRIHRLNSFLRTNENWNRFSTDLYFNPGFRTAKICLLIPPDINLTSIYQVKDITITQNMHPDITFMSQKPGISQIPEITYKKINPTKYKVRIERANQPFFLIFSETFDPGWKIYKNTGPANDYDSTILASYYNGEIKESRHENVYADPKIFSNIFKKSIPEANHIKANLYANAWYLEDKGNFDLTIEYVPQRYYMVSIIISVITFVVLIIWLFI